MRMTLSGEFEGRRPRGPRPFSMPSREAGELAPVVPLDQ